MRGSLQLPEDDQSENESCQAEGEQSLLANRLDFPEATLQKEFELGANSFHPFEEGLRPLISWRQSEIRPEVCWHGSIEDNRGHLSTARLRSSSQRRQIVFFH